MISIQKAEFIDQIPDYEKMKINLLSPKEFFQH